MMLRKEEFDVLDELRKTGPLPLELEERYQKLRRQEFFQAGLVCDRYLPSLPSRLENTDMTVSDWLKTKWASADKTVRHSLRLLADALNIPLPLRRTHSISASTAKDSSPARRTESTRHPNDEEPAPAGSLPDIPAEFRVDGRQWHDDDADGWQPSESLTDALHDALHPEERGWF